MKRGFLNLCVGVISQFYLNDEWFHKFVCEKVMVQETGMVIAYFQNTECDSRNMTIPVVMNSLSRVFANFIIPFN